MSEERELSCSTCGHIFKESDLKGKPPQTCPKCGEYGHFYYVFRFPIEVLAKETKEKPTISFDVTITAGGGED